MNPAQVGKVLALVSPALAVGVVCFMLFATGYSQVSMEERAGSEGDPVEAASESGWMSAYEYSLENGDYVYFLWSGFIVIICLLAAGAALKGWVGLVCGVCGTARGPVHPGSHVDRGHGGPASPSPLSLCDPTQLLGAGRQLRANLYPAPATRAGYSSAT